MHFEQKEATVGLLYVIHDKMGMISTPETGLVRDPIIGILRIGPYERPLREFFPITDPSFRISLAHLTFEERSSGIVPSKNRAWFKQCAPAYKESLANKKCDGRFFEKIPRFATKNHKAKHHLCSVTISLEEASKLTTTFTQGHFFYIDLETARAIKKRKQKLVVKSASSYGPDGLVTGICFEDPVILDFVISALTWHSTHLHRLKKKAHEKSNRTLVFRFTD